jgi:quinoprotein glucose dehydrogenase
MVFHKQHLLSLILPIALAAIPVGAQQGAANGEWRYYGGDSGTTKYSPLDQINATNVKNLRIAWTWGAENFGKRPESNWEVTPLMVVEGVLYFTAGSRRVVVALNASGGETLWMYRLDEGARGNQVARTNNRGLAYWSEGKGDNCILQQLPVISLSLSMPDPVV